MEFWEILFDWILRGTGLFGVIVVIIRIIWTFFTVKTVWVDNVKINEYELSDPNKLESKDGPLKGKSVQYYPEYGVDEIPPYATYTVFEPEGIIIKKLKFKELMNEDLDNNTHDWKSKYKLKKEFKRIPPNRPICFIIERSEGLPSYKIEWKGDYGVKMTYDFGSNGRNGDNTSIGMECSYNPLTYLRKFLGLR